MRTILLIILTLVTVSRYAWADPPGSEGCPDFVPNKYTNSNKYKIISPYVGNENWALGLSNKVTIPGNPALKNAGIYYQNGNLFSNQFSGGPGLGEQLRFNMNIGFDSTGTPVVERFEFPGTMSDGSDTIKMHYAGDRDSPLAWYDTTDGAGNKTRHWFNDGNQYRSLPDDHLLRDLTGFRENKLLPTVNETSCNCPHKIELSIPKSPGRPSSVPRKWFPGSGRFEGPKFNAGGAALGALGIVEGVVIDYSLQVQAQNSRRYGDETGASMIDSLRDTLNAPGAFLDWMAKEVSGNGHLNNPPVDPMGNCLGRRSY